MHDGQFPPVFNHQYYASQYPNVVHLAFEDARRHFSTIGKKRGYMGSPVADRRSFVAFVKSMDFQQILEIGPGVHPAFAGDNVSYFDVRQGEEFYAYAQRKALLKNTTYDVQSLPKIDFYSESGSLKVVTQKFDLVFSAHCIEHTYDVISHINDVADILTEEGVYCLVVPDKRYCRDHFCKVSSIGDIIERHYDRSTEYHPLSVFLDSLLKTHNDKTRHWNNDHGDVKIQPEAISEKIARWRETQGKKPMHGWYFTDTSFEDIFSLLHRARIIRMRPIRVYNTPKNSASFCVVMKPDVDDYTELP